MSWGVIYPLTEKKKKKKLQRENVISSKLHSKLSWVKFQTLTDCIPLLGLFPLCNIFLNSVRIPFSSNPRFLVCDIWHWYNVLKTFFQQDIYMSSSKISTLLTGLFVGNTSKCQLDNFQTSPAPIQHNPHFVLLGQQQQQATAIMGTRYGQD